MHLNSLSLSQFRNFTRLQLEVSDGINIFFGGNGSGKTNLLEAVFVLCLGRSHRGAADRVLVQNGTDMYRLEGTITGTEHLHTVAVAFERSGRKKVTVDQVGVRMSELFEMHAVVAAGPEDSAVLQGAPALRRTFIDVYLSQVSKKYLALLVEYSRALAQKNAALKAELDSSPFDAILMPLGAAITEARAGFIRELNAGAGEAYAAIASREQLTLTYQSSAAPGSESESRQEIESAFEVRLQAHRDREAVLRTALIGPHRDDVLFLVNDRPARTHASQGEIRTAAIALKLAIYQVLKAGRRTPPVLLLDEIFAELDENRTHQLIESFAPIGQLFLTTAQRPPALLMERGQPYQVRAGTVEMIA